MTVEVENKAVEQQVKNNEETKNNQVIENPQVKPEETKPEDANWKAFREARKKDREEREAAEKRAKEKEEEITALKAAMEAAFNKTNTNYSNSNPYEYGQEETEEQKIEKKVNQILAQKEELYRREAEERERREYPNRLQQNYPDFNQTITQENLDYLDYHFPEVSRPLQRLSEGYDKWSDIYKAIKKFVPNYTNTKKDIAKAEINQMKPKSMSTGHMTQTQNSPGANILSEERRAANWERMKRTMNSVGNG